MNLYECILQVSNCIKDKEEIKELIEKYKKVKKLKQDIKYSFFFSLLEGKEFYNFFAPNISMQIINSIYNNNDFEIMSKEVCELIINNQDIREYVKTSTQVNKIVSQEIMSLFSPKELKGDSKKVYVYNRLSEKLGYIGALENLKKLAGKGKEIENYSKERKKIVEPSIKLFPIYKFNDEFLKKVYELNISKEVINVFEKFNLMLYIIERIIYCNIYDKILYMENKDVKILDENEKLNMVYKKMLINDARLIFSHFPILVLEDNYYFPYSINVELMKGEATIESFTSKLEGKNALLNLSITDTIELFKKNKT